MIRSAQLSGDRRAIPEGLFDDVGKIVVQPCVEMLILCEDEYLLQKRSNLDSGNFGAGLLHIPGGFLKPVPGESSVLASAQWMASVELGIQHLDYVAGPIAVCRWAMEAHPYANPLSLVYVFKMRGIQMEMSGVVRHKIGTLPDRDAMISGHGGTLHYRMLQIFNQAYKDNFSTQCIDMDME